MNIPVSFKKKCFFIFFMLAWQYSHAQNLLNRIISIEAEQQPLSKILKDIGRQGDFYFSYNSVILKSDSLVSLVLNQKTVKQVLDALFEGRYQYKESGKYIIIQPAVLNQTYIISGYVQDSKTGERISDATVYEPRQLVSAFTDDHGFFRLALKNKEAAAIINISKISYTDTSVIIPSGHDEQLNVVISSSPLELNSVYVYNKVEKAWLARLFISSRQRVQSLNLSNFFANQPVQVSLVPGLGTHGRLGAQVVNKVSLNVVGGYTAGVNGLELAGGFNLVKKDMKKVQIAGAFNVVGGNVKGMQMAGYHNEVLDSLLGLQASGFSNRVKTGVKGMQLSGFYNQASSSAAGVQATGGINVAGKAKGVQLAGIANISKREMSGVQLGGFFNYAKRLKGVQIGFINITDTSEGYSIGLINISRNYHVLTVYADELAPVNFSFKSGNKKLYGIMTVGFNFINNHKLIYLGYGFGSEINFSKSFFISPELRWGYVYTGKGGHDNDLVKFNLNANFRLGKSVSVFAGPSFSMFRTNQIHAVDGYQFPLPSAHYSKFNMGDKWSGWIGWQVGINLF